MARIFPQWIPDSERETNLGRRAEFLVNDCLSEQLGDDWLVLYSQAIKWAHPHGVSDREADFIVAHPNLGVVMIEVKGGSITHEGGSWYSTPLNQLERPVLQRQRHPIKDPYDQATGAAKSYERKLDDFVRNQIGPRSARLPDRRFNIATAVCFPDIEIPSGFHLAGNALPELTLSRLDLPKLKDRIYQILKLYQGQAGRPPGEAGIELLIAVLARDWHIDSYLIYEFDTAEQKRKQLTEEQFRLLYSLEYNPKMLITGCAGSGKTMLAAEKARNLADQGYQILFTCYNAQLADWLNDSPFKRDNIKVTYFHDLCRWAAGRSQEIDLPEWDTSLGISKEKYYSETMPEALMLAAEEQEIKFDAIIIDEGQDFEESWFHVLYGLLRDPDKGICYLFFDDNQKVYGKKRKIPFQWPIFRLTKNMRNTDPIFELLVQYYHQPQVMLRSGISGPRPTFVSLKNYRDANEALQDILAHLVEQKIPLNQIVILTPQDKLRSLWSQVGHRSAKFIFNWGLKPPGNQVACSSIRTFKGLERPVIILTELDYLQSWQVQEMMYVAISRAKNQLIVLGDLPKVGVEEAEDDIF